MQSENGILLLFYIFLSHGNEKKKNGKRGDAVSCPQTFTCESNYHTITATTGVFFHKADNDYEM
jgi:hypothetical protein